jgi:hypothetical protein
MANLLKIVKQITKERDRLEKQLSGLNAALKAFAGVYRGTKRTGRPTDKARRKRHVSAKSRAKMAAAQRARWAKVRAKDKARRPH